MDEIGIEKARVTLGDIIDRARMLNQPTRITRHGKPGAVVVSEEWYAWATGVIDGLKLRDGVAPAGEGD